MSFAYLPLYTGDYLRDTRHLSMAEHGAYLLMLTYCWDQKGPLPLDRHRIQGICNARSKDEQEAVERVLADFFVVMDDGLYNKRMQAEIERCDNISRARAEAGKLGYEARAKHLPSKRQANAKQVHLSPSPSLSPPPVKPPEPTVQSPQPPVADPIPYQRIVDLYHQKLSMLPRVFDLSPARKAQIRARWKEGSLPDLDAWAYYFDQVAKSRFLTGMVDPKGGRKPFLADLEWITKQTNFLKVAEDKYA